jgi:hypothetical protein
LFICHIRPAFFGDNPMNRLSTISFCLGVLLFCTHAIPGSAADDRTPKFNVKTRKMADTVQIEGDQARVVLSVKSPSGIGSAIIDRVEKSWPGAVALKLHLGGLESLVISNGKEKLSVAVSSQDGKPRVRVWKDDKEGEPLDSKSSHWMEVRIVGADGKPAEALPLKNGTFEMTLPRALLEGNPPSLTVQWIDFYRG